MNLTIFFKEHLDELPCEPDTAEYIVSVFNRPVVLDSTVPVTIEWQRARDSGAFEHIQRIGDAIFWTCVFAPESLKHAPLEYYETIGACAYSRCHVILRREWPLYKELSMRFGDLTRESRRIIRSL